MYHVQSLGHSAVELHVLHDIHVHVRPLTLVRGDDADLVGLDPSLHQLRHHLLHIHRLTPGGVKGQRQIYTYMYMYIVYTCMYTCTLYTHACTHVHCIHM